MTVWPGAATLSSSDGELLLVRISVEARSLEDLLESLAELDYPINPQLYHRPAETTVEFPAYDSWLPAIRRTLAAAALSAHVTANPMLHELQLDSPTACCA